MIDTLQTLPSFVYLIPVVMLFRVGDFTAMMAVVLYALAPAIRYAAHGSAAVDPQTDRGRGSLGLHALAVCARSSCRWRCPEILLGLNQTIMLALSMLVITALVGTRDLGQEVYIALTKADTGRGIVAGCAVAFIAIIADRIIAASARTHARTTGPDMTDCIAAARHAPRSLPIWTGPVRREPLGGGITNVNFVVEDAGALRRPDRRRHPVHQVMRFNELAASRAAHAAGFRRRSFTPSPASLVLDFIEAKTLGRGSGPRRRDAATRIVPLIRAATAMSRSICAARR